MNDEWIVTISYIPDEGALRQTLEIILRFTSWELAAAVIATIDPNTVHGFTVRHMIDNDD